MYLTIRRLPGSFIHVHFLQVNALDISPDGQLLAAAGYQHIRMFDVNSNNASPVVNYEGTVVGAVIVYFGGSP